MGKVAKNILFQNYMRSFVRKKEHKLLFVLLIFSSFFMLQRCCYAMQYTDEPKKLHDVKRTLVQNGGDDLNNIPYEGRITSLPPITQESPQSWKQNWVVKNIIADFPIIGDFFHDDPSILDSIMRAGKTTCMLVGGSIGMMLLHVIPVTEKDDMATKAAKNSFNMAIGMWVGMITYNTVLSLGHMGYNCIKGEGNS